MSIFEAIVNHFNEHIDATSRSIESLTPYIAEAANLLGQILVEDKKIICIAAPSCFAAGQQFCHNLLGSSTLDRPALPAIFLNNSNTASSGICDLSNQYIHATQVSALGQAGDLLLSFSFNGEESAIVNAIHAANNRQMKIISITSGNALAVANQTPKNQVHIPVTGFNVQQSMNLHFVLAQILSDLVEQQLFGNISQ